jgi:hypothetical protein
VGFTVVCIGYVLFVSPWVNVRYLHWIFGLDNVLKFVIKLVGVLFRYMIQER